MSTLIVFKSGVQITVPHTVTAVQSYHDGRLSKIGWEPAVKEGKQIMDIQLTEVAFIMAIQDAPAPLALAPADDRLTHPESKFDGGDP